MNVAWKATGIKPEQLDYDELPENVVYVWRWFCELNQYRGSNGFGANPITPTDIKDWCWLNEIKLEQWEIKAIKMIDNCFLNSQAKDAK